jgi:hypothetical protein
LQPIGLVYGKTTMFYQTSEATYFRFMTMSYVTLCV